MSKSCDELETAQAFLDWVVARNPNEPEFHQAVAGVVRHVIDIARDEKRFSHLKILQRLTEPDRIISFRVMWEDDDGEFHINRGYRVQHCNAIGPYKGGIRFSPTVNQSVLKFLAFEQTFKNSLTGLDLGAGKGGSDFDPHGRSDSELMRFCQAFMTELSRHIGSQIDVPAGDIGVGAREIGFLFGQYKRLQNEFGGALTGKADAYGGSILREEATGYGAVYFLQAMLAESGEELAGKRVAVSGMGNVAIHVAEKAVENDANVITLSNRDGYIRCYDGLTRDHLQSIESGYADGKSPAEIADEIQVDWVADAKPWEVECEVAVPSAAENELDNEDAKALIDNSCKWVVEAANMPLTNDAEDLFDDAGVAIAPGKAANAGGVAVSGFEMTQNRLGRSWTHERLDNELREVMASIFEKVKAEGQDGERIDYRRGADRAGFRRVATALAAFGAV